MGLEALSDDDLLALKSGDLSKVSDAGLVALKGPSGQPQPVEQTAPERSTLQNIGRQVGLTGRAGLSGVGLSGLANMVGLPQPENATERVVQDVAGTMFGGGAIGAGAKALAKGAGAIAQPILNMLAANPGAQAVSSAGAGAGGGVAREFGAEPMGQAGAALAGGMTPSVVGAPVRWVGNKIGDIGATIGASFGNQRGIERISKDAAQRVAGESRGKQLAALMNSQEYAPGVQPTVAEAIAQAQLGKPEQFGGATIKLQKDLSGARGIEDVLPSNARQQRNALATHLKGVKSDSKPMRENSLQAANIGGVKASDVIDKLDASMNVSGSKADDLLQKSLGAVKEKIIGLSDETGRIDANELYTIRKKLGSTIGRFSKETADWDKRNVSGVEREVQKAIDDAIEGAGGKGWKDYLKFYSTGKKAADTAKEVQREAKLIAAGVKGSSAAELAAGEIPHPPTLLSRPMMALNYVLKNIVGDANTPVSRYMAEQMRNPQDYAKLLRGDPVRSTAMDAARRAAIAAALQQGNQP